MFSIPPSFEQVPHAGKTSKTPTKTLDLKFKVNAQFSKLYNSTRTKTTTTNSVTPKKTLRPQTSLIMKK